MATVKTATDVLAKLEECTMSYISNLHVYFSLIKNFCISSISATEFESKYSVLWSCDRNEESMLKANTAVEMELCNKLKNGQINDVQFSEQCGIIYGYTLNESKIRSIQDRIYTTCNCFWNDITEEEVDPPLILNERLFREEVIELLHELEQVLAENR